MQLLRPLARPLLASAFVAGGLDAILNSEGKVKAAEFVTRPLSERFSFITEDTETLVRANGATQLVGGVVLALGRLTRLSSLALITSIIPTTIANHRFWEATSDEERTQQRANFLKNAGLLGGLLLALAAGSTGRARPGTAIRTQRKERQASRTEGHERATPRSHRKDRSGSSLPRAGQRVRLLVPAAIATTHRAHAAATRLRAHLPARGTKTS